MSDQPPILGPMQPLPWRTGADTPTPAVPTPAPEPTPEPRTAQPEPPSPEERRAKAAAKKADGLRVKARRLEIVSHRWTLAVIVISAIITAFGSGNAHEVFIRHDTQDPWAWFPYPALEAALIVEIQIGGALAEHAKRVIFWGAALRFVTAGAAITVCVYGPAEKGDWGGAALHAIGPFVQFWLAEFLARSRAEFKAAVEDLLARADGREQAAERRTEARTEPGKKRTKKASSGIGRAADGRTGPDGPRTKTPTEDTADDPGSSAGTDDEDLLVRARAAADELERTDQRLNRDNLVRVIRAGGGTIQNKDAGRILTGLRAERGGPDLHPVREKGA